MGKEEEGVVSDENKVKSKLQTLSMLDTTDEYYRVAIIVHNEILNMTTPFGKMIDNKASEGRLRNLFQFLFSLYFIPRLQLMM